MSNNGTDDLISLAEAGELMGCCDRTIRRRISSGELTGYRIGRTGRVIRVKRSDVLGLLRPMVTVATVDEELS